MNALGHNPLKILKYDCLDSTQLEAWRLLESHEALPFVVWALEQTQGKGRRGRTWEAEPGRSLCFSLALQLKPESVAALSLLVGLILCELLELPQLKIKWPNDLILNDQKVGGILIESRSQGEVTELVIGVGINLFDLERVNYFGLGKAIDPELLFQKLYDDLMKRSALGFSKYREDFERRMWRRDQSVRFQLRDDLIEGKILGVDDFGRLNLASGERLILESDGELLLG